MKSNVKFKKTSLEKLVIYGSIISLIYFVTLITFSHYKINFIIVGVFVELLTIPFLLLLPFLVVFSIKYWSKEKVTNQF